MLARLGNVIFWLFCAAAGVLVLLTLADAFSHRFDGAFLMAMAVVAGAICTIGRGIQYVLAGT